MLMKFRRFDLIIRKCGAAVRLRAPHREVSCKQCADLAFQPVTLTRRRTGRFGGAFHRKVEALAVAAHPADLPGRHADHQREGRHVAIDDGAGADEGVFPDRVAADDGAIGPEGGAAPDQGVAVFVLAGYGAAGIVDIGEDHARAAEHVILQRHVVVHRDVVLDLDVVADDDPVADEDILAEGAIAADDGLAADMDPMPDAGVVANPGAFVDDGSVVDGVIGHGELS